MSKFTKTYSVFLAFMLISILTFGQSIAGMDAFRSKILQSHSLFTGEDAGISNFDYTKLVSSDATKDVLYDNGPFITSYGASQNGLEDYSEIQDGLGMMWTGEGFSSVYGLSISDDFEVTSIWEPTTFTFYGFQFGLGTNYTFDDVKLQIWDGDPREESSSVIWGDIDGDNLFLSSAWTNSWRVTQSNPIEDIPIMEIVADVSGLVLNPGIYWVQYAVDGPDSDESYAPFITILGQTTTGNGLVNAWDTWNELYDVGPQGLPFVINGTIGDLADNDLVLDEVISPNTGVELGMEDVTIKILNLGENAQSNFEVSYTVDGGTPVTETITETIASLEFLEFTFSTQADLSAFGQYEIEACVNLAGDENPDNDCETKLLENLEPSLCAPLYGAGCNFGDGFTDFALEQIENYGSGCDNNAGTGWSQYLELGPAQLSAGETYTVTMGAEYGSTYTTIWIDFNDDLVLTADEIIVENYVLTGGGVLDNVEFTLPADAPEGQHVMRARSRYNFFCLDACEQYFTGEAEDYYVVVGGGATSELLYDNGPFVTSVGVGSGGSDYSELQGDLGMAMLGMGFSSEIGLSICDDFEVTSIWEPTTFTFYGFQEELGLNYTFDEVRIQIWDGDPTDGGSVIWGNIAGNNLFLSSQWTNSWRVVLSNPVEDRPIMEIVADVSGLVLNPGNYWVQYSVNGPQSIFSFAPLITILGETTTGNAMVNVNSAFEPIEDVGPQGLPFLIHGTIGDLPGNDLVLYDIISPSTGVELGMEYVTIKILNLGENAQSNFEVSYTVDGGTPVTETITETIASLEFLEFTFSTQADLSAFGQYEIEACVNLAGDENPDNNCLTELIENLEPSLCVPEYNTGCSFGDGFTDFALEQIENYGSGCEENTATGWSQYFELGPAELSAGGTYTVTLGAGYSLNFATVWIDFNDDLVFTADEMIVESYALPLPGELADVEFAIPPDAPEGQHYLRARTNYNGDCLDACEEYNWGEAEDYYVMIVEGAYGNLEGTVTHAESGAAIEGATVTAGSNTTTTGADGMYSFIDIVSATYTVSCTAAGYVGQTETAIVEEGQTTTLDFALVEEEVPGIVFEDDFEDYVAGEMVACQKPFDWTTWANDPCGPDDAYVSTDQANSGVNSVNIISNDDLVMDLDEYLTEGKHTVSVMIYVPTGGDAYYNILSAFVPAPEWAFEVYFNAGGDASVNAGGTSAATFNYSFDTWMESKVVIDLNADWAEYYLDGNLIIEWQYTLGAAGDGSALTIGALDFFGATASTTYYFDDLLIETEEGLPAPTNLTAEVVGGNDVELNWQSAAGTGGWIYWDQQENIDAIGLTSGGTFSGASRWEPADLTPYDGMYLTQVSYYHFENASTAEFTVKVWTGPDAGTLMTSQVVSGSVMADWNIIELDNPVMIDASDEFWFGVEVTHPAGENPLGIDPGPAIQYKGDMLFNGEWFSMSYEYGIDHNWNLAGLVAITADGTVAQPMAKTPTRSISNDPIASLSISKASFASASQMGTATEGGSVNSKFNPTGTKDFLGYNVYRDGTVIAEEIFQTNYTDYDLLPGTYTYNVKAVYDEGISNGAGPADATILGGIDRDLVVIEVATGTWCQFCPGSAMAVDEMHAEGLSVGIIEYHSGDDYETTESAARIAYYGITGFPTAEFDGVEQVVGGNATQSMYATYLPKYETRIEIPSLFEIDAEYHNTSGTNYTLSVDAEMVVAYPWLENDIVLQAAITESHIPEAWQNQTELNFVCRDMIPNENGTAIDFSGSATQSLTLDFTIPANYVMNNLEVVVFIQDNTTMEILQGSLAMLTSGVEDVMSENQVAVYPNPASEVVNITSDFDITSIKVFNHSGQVIANEIVHNKMYQINTSQYNAGMYFFQIETTEGTISKRIIVQ